MVKITVDRHAKSGLNKPSPTVKMAEATSRLITIIGLSLSFFFCFACSQPAFGQSLKSTNSKAENQAEIELNNGNYQKAIELADAIVRGAKKTNNLTLLSEALNIKASAEIYLENYDNARKTLDEALQTVVDEKEASANRKALTYITYAWLFRSQRQFPESFDYSKKAVAVAPENHYVLAAHYLNTGRILFASGHDVSAIVWLEKAENLLESDDVSRVKLETYRFLTLAWSSKLNYEAALRYGEKSVSSGGRSPFKYIYRQALLDLETVLSVSGQKKRAQKILERGLMLSVKENNSYQACKFLVSLLLHSLDNNDTTSASAYLNKLQRINADNKFSFEIYLTKAVISAFEGERVESEEFFALSEKQENAQEFLLLYWKIIVASKNSDWRRVINLNRDLMELTVRNNFRDGLPKIYLTFAEAYFHLKQIDASVENLEKCLSYIEEIRKAENYNLSLGLYENYHDAYRLLTQTKIENSTQEAFEFADFLKARLLKDKIDNSLIKPNFVISPKLRKTLEELSAKSIGDEKFNAELEKQEKLSINPIFEFNLTKPDLAQIDKLPDFDDSAIVSYLFTPDKKLTAFVKEKNQPVKVVSLPISETEMDVLAKTTERKIKTLIFFKGDGKEIYDKLLKPLNLTSKHLIIIPDKSLWKIPFQATSADGKKYLIEDRLVSYAPSVSILLEQMKSEKPSRKTIQVFANANYDGKFLRFVDSEAVQISNVFNSKPIQDATTKDFMSNAGKSDILHFSMHAQIDSEQPLQSFLGFRKSHETDDGRITVEKLLRIKLKEKSMVFFASCETNNILNGEGLVSLSWAAMSSGATTVVSAQWAADDKSTQFFTKTFYTNYRRGVSPVEAVRIASLEMIKNKSNDMHAPYYWANFTLNGDFR